MSELVSRNDMLADFANLAKEFDTALINAKSRNGFSIKYVLISMILRID